MWLTFLYYLKFLILVIDLVRAIEPFVVGGKYAKIEQYPHSAFLAITCRESAKSEKESWICGSSILNQQILLTAGHCLENCLASSSIGVTFGNAHRKKGYKTKGAKFIIHEHYNPTSLCADIALVQVATPIRFNYQVKRVAILRNTPFNEEGEIAGWGLVDEEDFKGTMWLKFVKQKIWTRKDCLRILKKVPKGCICGGNSDRLSHYASEGDSGGALVIRGFIQIGLVSYKVPSKSRSLVVYTEVSHYYDWIEKSVSYMYCNK